MRIQLLRFGLLIVLLSWFGLQDVWAANSAKGKGDKVIVDDLGEKWQYINNGNVLPYFEKYDKAEIIFQKVNYSRYHRYNFNIYASPDLSVYFNNRLIYKNTSGEWEYKIIPLEKGEFIMDSDSEMLISLHDPSNRFCKTSFIGNSGTVSQVDNPLPVYPERYNVPFQDLTLIIFLLTITCITILKYKYPRRFKEILSFKSIFSVNSSEENTLKVDSFTFWGLIMINTFAFYLIALLLNSRPEIRDIYDLLHFYPDTLGGFVKATAVILGFLLARYMYLLITGNIFRTSVLVGQQFSEFVRLISLANILFVVAVVMFNVSNFFRFEFSYIYFFWGIFLVLLVIMLKSSFLIFKLSSFKNFYLISYLCISEILPLLVIIKILININIF